MKKLTFALVLMVLSAFGAEYLQNGDFETGEIKPWGFPRETKASASIRTDSAPAGGRGVLAINLPPDGERKISFHQKVKLGPGTYQFSCYVDTTGVTVPKGFVQFYVSGTVEGKWTNYGGFHIGGTHPKLGWRKYPWTKLESTVTIPENGVANSVWIEFINTVGTVLLDNFSLSDDKPNPPEPQPTKPTKGSKAFSVSLIPGGVKALFTQDQIPEFTLTVENVASDGVMSVNYRTVDYFGNQVLTTTGSYPLKVGEPFTETISYPQLKEVGFYCTTASWKFGALAGEAQVSFVKVGPLLDKPDRLFGISVYADAEVERYKLMGVGTKGYYFKWRYMEDENGNLDLEPVRQEIQALKAAGIRVMGHFDTAEASRLPRRYVKSKVEDKQDPIVDQAVFYRDKEAFVEKIVTTFKDDIHEWGAGCEINLKAYQADYIYQRYIDEVKLMSRAIRRADPTAIFVAIGCSGADGRSRPRYPFLRKILPEIVDDIDGFGIDQYTSGQTYGKGYVLKNTEEGELREMMLTLLQIAHDNGKHFVSIDEKGPSIIRNTPLDSHLGTRMANMAARDYIILKTVPEVKHWLYFRPDNWSKTSIVDWGMWEKGNPRQVVSAYSATARSMAHAEFLKGKELCEDIPCWLFRKDDRFFATLWYNGAEPLEFKLPADARFSVLDVQGKAVAVQRNTLILADAPQYLLADSLAELEGALEKAEYTVPELGATVEVIAAKKMQLALRNLSGKAFSAKVEGFKSEPPQALPSALTGTIELAPNETRILELPFASESCSFELKTSNGQRFEASRAFRPYCLSRFAGWENMANAMPIVLDDPSRQMPGYDDLKANKIYNGQDDLSAVGRFAYDDNCFYMEVVAKDDTHFNVQTPARCFNGDCVQFAFDTRKDARIKLLKNIQGLTEDDYNYVSALASGKPVTHCYGAADETRERLRGKELESIPQITRDETAKTTTYRIAIPFADLAPLRPIPGNCFGFSFLVFDSDSDQSKLIHLEASPGITNPTNPAAFLEFLF